ncbi:MAG: FHA domain-containing protein [Deltaproteobacteria bacterium]|nr:FHA domain-containing protein [Deltaproteobacteria bacterium]
MFAVEYTDNRGAVKTIELSENSVIIVGRNPSCHIYTTNPSVSRNHGKIYFDAGRFLFQDLGSVNGTKLNDKPIKKSEIKTGDTLKCGDFIIRITEKADEQPVTEQAKKTPAKEPAREAPAASPQKEAKPAKPRTERERPPAPRVDEAVARERDAFKEEVLKLRERLAKGEGDAVGAIQLVERLKEEKEELNQRIKSLNDIIAEGEKKTEEIEKKNKRLEFELDSFSDKYMQSKDQITHLSRLLEQEREDVAGRDEHIVELEQKVKELSAVLDSLREKGSESGDVINNLKVKLTHKEREIEQLQRQFDLMEFELRGLREENEALQHDFNRDGGAQKELERRVNQLREIINEKENYIGQLRLDLEEKDREVRETRMGVGISDLEEEKRKLLNDYYQKSREVDELNAKAQALIVERNEAQEKIAQLQDQLESIRASQGDISIHPDFKQKAREAEKLAAEKEALEAERAGFIERLKQFTPETKARFEAEIEVLRAKNQALSEKVEALSRQVHEKEDEKDRFAGEISAKISEFIETLSDTLGQLKGDVLVAKSYLRDLSVILQALKQVKYDELPENLVNILADINIEELTDSVEDIVKVIENDMAQTDRIWAKTHDLTTFR